MSDKTESPKVKLSFICLKEWDQLEPCASGNICSSCQKTVFDLSQKSSSEIMHLQQVHGALCGRFYRNQIQVQNRPNFWWKAITGIVLSLGLSSVSEKTHAQTLNEAHKETPQKEKEADFVFGMVVESMPVFKKGGNEELMRFIHENLQNPTKITGFNVVSFVVDTLGKPVAIQVLKSLSNATNGEAIRVAKLLESLPAMQHGKKVPSRFTIRMHFFSTKPKGFKYKCTT